MDQERYQKLLKLVNEQKEFIQEIEEESAKSVCKVLNSFGHVFHVYSQQTGELFVSLKPGIDKPKKGSSVLVVKGLFISSIVQDTINSGELCLIADVFKDTRYCEIESNGTKKFIYIPPYLDINSLKKGSEVVVDKSAAILLSILKRQETKNPVKKETGVSWDSIGGNNSAKKDIRDAVELPILKKEVFEFYGKKATKGILLYGPPGCGKTMFGKAIVTSLNDLHKTNLTNFIYVKATEILNAYVGESEAKLRKVFNDAKEYEEKSGAPCVIFIDEADAILGSRSQRNNLVEKTIVPTFLTEMDGLEKMNSLVILATNRPDMLDSAVTRDGRIDRKIFIDRPDKSASKDILKIYLNKVKLAKETNINTLSELFISEVFSEKYAYAQNNTYKLFLSHFISGAMIKGIVQKALSFAIDEDLHLNSKPTGLKKEHLLKAIQVKYEENAHIDHQIIINELQVKNKGN